MWLLYHIHLYYFMRTFRQYTFLCNMAYLFIWTHPPEQYNRILLVAYRSCQNFASNQCLGSASKPALYLSMSVPSYSDEVQRISRKIPRKISPAWYRPTVPTLIPSVHYFSQRTTVQSTINFKAERFVYHIIIWCQEYKHDAELISSLLEQTESKRKF